jgi:D-3-phosphoglycerate dehydrogenase
LSSYKVVITDLGYETYEPEKTILKKINARVVLADCKKAEEVGETCADADGVIVRMAPCTRKAIQSMKKCRVIARYGVGVDNVDLAAATEKGIRVVNVPDYCFEEVSDQAMALFLACSRKTARRDREVRKMMWDIGAKDPVYRISGKVFGLIGYGNIPRVLHRKLKGFNLGRILVHDPFLQQEFIREQGAEPSDLETLIRESDYISVHAPLNDKTRGMIGVEQFSIMKKSVILINTSRGGVIDESALVQALKNGQINSAGLDVYENEPLPQDSPLRQIENVVLCDHAGWYSEEGQIELQTKAAQGVADVLEGRIIPNIVNKKVLEKFKKGEKHGKV